MNKKMKDFRRRLEELLPEDRIKLQKSLINLGMENKKGADPRQINDRSAVLEKRFLRAEERKKRRINERPRVTYPGDLPILERKEAIIEGLRRNQVLVVTGETGSGKTTQLPKMCLEAGRGINGVIGCTQPRRIAAISIANRVAEELGEEAGHSVGYKIRFEDRTSRRGYIKFMTDGILLMEAQSDPSLRSYDTLIVDEAHERSINIDFILGYLKRLMAWRRDLKVIITSATIDSEKFSRVFDNAPVIKVSGRTWPVEIHYRPSETAIDDDNFPNHIEAAVAAVKELKKDWHGGHTLIFMPTEQDIRDTCEILKGCNFSNTVILPLYARLSEAGQKKIFQPLRMDKIIVATNVAETSITVPGIRFVIDSGLARISEYRPQTRTTGLPVKAIAKSSAAQRAGRAGRLEKGLCIRLYSGEDYEGRPDFTPPEILRTNLAEVILRMLHLNIGDIASFPFIDKPRPKSIRDGYDILLELGAVRPGKTGYRLTEQGRRMASLPLDPRIARILLEARKNRCLREILVIAAALSIQDPRERPSEKEREADRAHKTFVNPSSDFITLINIWDAFHRSYRGSSESVRRAFCREHFLSLRRIREWKSVHDELEGILQDSGLMPNDTYGEPLRGEALYEAVHKCILAGYISQFAVKKDKNLYRFAKGGEAMVFPGSGLFNGDASWIVSAEMIETSRVFARMNGKIKSDWLEEVGGSSCVRSWCEPRWDTDRGEVVATEQVSLFGLVIVQGRTISYGHVKPDEAAEIFIREAILGEKLFPAPPFLKHNHELIDRILTMENKIRKRTILVDEEDLVLFYRERLGTVYDSRTLRSMLRDKNFDESLRMKEKDIRRWFPEEDLLDYPDEVSLGGARFSLTYRFNPGSNDDGITLNIPPHLLKAAAAESPDWKIPGLLREKVQALIKALPKEYRRRLIPIGRAVDIAVEELGERKDKNDASILKTLSSVLQKRFGVCVPAMAWPVERIPDHLSVRYALVGKKKRELKASRKIDDLLWEDAAGEIDRDLAEARKGLERGPLTHWDMEELPEWIDFHESRKGTLRVHPALVEEGEEVFLRVFRNGEEASALHARGVRRLWEVQFSKDRKYLLQCLALPEDLRRRVPWSGGSQKFESLLGKLAEERLIGGAIRSRKAFLRCASEARPRIYETAREVMGFVEPVLRLYMEARRTFADLKGDVGANRGMASFIDSLSDHLEQLVPPDFPILFDEERLARIAVYLRGILIRCERGLHHLDKDRSKAGKVLPFTEALERLRATLPAFSSMEKRYALDEFALMIEEFRLSVFAPELKTAFPISSKRLKEKLAEIEGMV